ncbi:hypothetical protein ACLB1S_01525 [Escherichia coli]
MQQRRPVRRALLSVSDKAGIVDSARHFPHAVWSCCLQGALPVCSAEKGLPVTEVSDYTGFPEMIDDA